jgi:hypothetical protein
MQQKREQDRRRAQALERKRRMLDEGEVLVDDEEAAITLEDMSAMTIQRIARGKAARSSLPLSVASPHHSQTCLFKAIRAGAEEHVRERRDAHVRRCARDAAPSIGQTVKGQAECSDHTAADHPRHDRTHSVAIAAAEPVVRPRRHGPWSAY